MRRKRQEIDLTRRLRDKSERRKKRFKRGTPAGLGTGLGGGLKHIRSLNWVIEEERLRDNREKIEKALREQKGLHDVFSTAFFNSKENCFNIAAGDEGELRLFPVHSFDPPVQIKTYIRSETQTPIFAVESFRQLVIKRFKKHARSSPQNQARVLYSLRHFIGYLEKDLEWKPKTTTPMTVRVSCPLAIKANYAILRPFLRSQGYLALEELSPEIISDVHEIVMDLSHKILHAEKRLIRFFDDAGLVYPTPDFIPENFFLRFDKNDPRQGHLIIVDQFSQPVNAKDPHFRHRQERWIKRKWEKLLSKR